MWKSKLGKSRRGERIHYYQEVTMNFTELYYDYILLDPIPPLVRGKGPFIHSCCPEGSWNDDEIDLTVVIFTYGIVIITAIVGACLLESHAENPLPSITV